MEMYGMRVLKIKVLREKTWKVITIYENEMIIKKNEQNFAMNELKLNNFPHNGKANLIYYIYLNQFNFLFFSLSLDKMK